MFHESPVGCKKGDRCDFLHREKRAWLNNGNNPNPSDAPHVLGRFQQKTPRDMPFLDQGQMMMMEILKQLQMLNQDRNNNGRHRAPQWPMNR